MIKGDINQQINETVKQTLATIPHTLNNQQEKLVLLICRQIIQSFAETLKQEPTDNKAEIELNKIKKTWKELNKLLQ